MPVPSEQNIGRTAQVKVMCRSQPEIAGRLRLRLRGLN
jgi:hypothetical protein